MSRYDDHVDFQGAEFNGTVIGKVEYGRQAADAGSFAAARTACLQAADAYTEADAPTEAAEVRTAAESLTGWSEPTDKPAPASPPARTTASAPPSPPPPDAPDTAGR